MQEKLMLYGIRYRPNYKNVIADRIFAILLAIGSSIKQLDF